MVLRDLKQSSSENKPRLPGRLESGAQTLSSVQGWEQNQPGPATPGRGRRGAPGPEEGRKRSPDPDPPSLRQKRRASWEGWPTGSLVGVGRPTAQKEQRLARGYAVPHGRGRPGVWVPRTPILKTLRLSKAQLDPAGISQGKAPSLQTQNRILR